VGLSYDHRSNGDIATLNPGLETLQLRVSVPLN
jgi:lipid A 3-O-deacylase